VSAVRHSLDDAPRRIKPTARKLSWRGREAKRGEAGRRVVESYKRMQKTCGRQALTIFWVAALIPHLGPVHEAHVELSHLVASQRGRVLYFTAVKIGTKYASQLGADHPSDPC
jgi:hypothetical protein